MQTWEWGVFQQALGRKVERYFVAGGLYEEPTAAFTIVYHSLPLGFSYGYVPRGPVIATHATGEKESGEVLKDIQKWAKQNIPRLVFLRLEPPLPSITSGGHDRGFYLPPYYIQPRYNLAVPIEQTEQEIIARFHPSTRSNIHRAENRGVKVETKSYLTEADLDQFFAMIKETIERNSGKNAYPSRSYFRALVETFLPLPAIHDPDSLSLGIFYGYQYGEPASAHFVLFFGDTATYLFGASYNRMLRSKVTTYLHWTAMQEAKRRGLRYYDLGGIDEGLWPTLTNFKRQFRGEEFRYIGNVDISIRPVLYRAYNLFRRLKK